MPKDDANPPAGADPLGLQALADWLSRVGRSAQVVALSQVPWLDQGAAARDRHLVSLDRGPIGLLSLRAAGEAGPVTELHALVWPTREAGHAALIRRSSGLFRRARADLRWKGDSLAVRLQADATLNEALSAMLEPGEDLRVDADPGREVVRVVLRRALRPPWGDGPQATLPLALLEALERVGRVVQRPSGG